MNLIGTYFHSPQQTAQAAMFAKQHAVKLNAAKELIQSAVKKFAVLVLPDILAAHLIDCALYDIEQGQFDRFYGMIRTNAHAQSFNCFWDVVFMLDTLGDVTGSFWPYMTEERRAAALEEAVELAHTVNSTEIGLRAPAGTA